MSVRLLLLAALFAAGEALACECVEQPFEQWVAGADAVFAGRVTGITARAVTFDVIDSWKGLREAVVAVEPLEACAVKLQPGRSYLVFAAKQGERLVIAPKCSPAAPLEQACEAVAKLGAPRPTYPSAAIALFGFAAFLALAGLAMFKDGWIGPGLLFAAAITAWLAEGEWPRARPPLFAPEPELPAVTLTPADAPALKIAAELREHKFGVSAVAFDREGTRVASAGEIDRKLCVWQLDAGTHACGEGRANALALDDALVTARYEQLGFYDPTTLEEDDARGSEAGHYLEQVRALGGGSLLIASESGVSVEEADGEVEVLQFSSWLFDRTIALSGDGRRFAIAGGELGAAVRVYSVDSTREVARFTRGCWSPKDTLQLDQAGDTLLWGDRLYDVEAVSGRRLSQTGLLSPDGKRLATPGPKIWALDTGKQLFGSPPESISPRAFSPDGTQVLGERDGTLFLLAEP